MANDCLVTKLKGVVNNNNLEKLGILTITAPASENIQNVVALGATENNTITVKVSGATFSDGTTSKTVGQWDSLALSAHEGTATIDIDSKYNIAGLQLLFSSISVDRLNCAFGLTSFATLYDGADYSTVTGNLSNLLLSKPNFGYLVLKGTNVSGNLNELSEYQNIEILYLSNNGLILGDIASLASCTKLTQLMISSYTIDGKLEDLGAGQFTIGRRNGEVELLINFAYNITLNDIVPYRTLYMIFSESGVTITESDKTTVLATYNGSTWTYNS